MPIDLDDFLRARKFQADPFMTTNAEQEVERLASYFVHVAWFDRLVGDPRYPESLILFAPRGHGKTSHRLEVARLAQQRRDAPALVVQFSDFDLLLDPQQPPTIERYLEVIRRRVIGALAAKLAADPWRRELALSQPDALVRFAALCCLYGEPGAFDLQPDGMHRWVDYYRTQPLGVREWLQTLSSLAAAGGFASIYLLLDGVDEWAATHAAPATALTMLRPLLSAPGMLQECGVAFKFFLPQDLEPLMQQQQVSRLDRIPTYRLVWSDSELVTMLGQRLTSYSLLSPASPLGFVNSFADLCDTPVPVDEWLARAAQSSPRRLLMLARTVIEAHCRFASSADAPVSMETLNGVLRDANGVIPAVPAAALGPDLPALVDAVSPLFFDEHGDIWIGSTCLPVTLPRMLRRCMEYLWDNRHRTVTYEELEAALYNDDLPGRQRGDPRSSCDKIIRRLRAILEPDKGSASSYIQVQPGTGYVLRNVRE